jgi:hypothetical protein
MRMRRTALLLAGACLALAGLAPTGAQASPEAAWTLSIAPMPSNFSPTALAPPEYLVSATNVGAAATTGNSVLKIKLPEGGFTAVKTIAKTVALGTSLGPEPTCTIAGAGREVTCETATVLPPGSRLQVSVSLSVTASPGTYETEAQASGGGAANAVSAVSQTSVQSEALPFGILPGFTAPLTGEEGAASTLAGSHPYQQTLSFSFTTREAGGEVVNDGFPRDFWAELPRGLTGDPGATPVLCTEAQLTGFEGCPLASQVGVADVTIAAGRGNIGVSSTALYNMVPPPGSVASLGTDVAGLGLFSHTLIDVRSDGDYGVEALTPDVIALGTNPVFGVQAQIWGDPSADAHDELRECKTAGGCSVEAQETAFLTAPADCPRRLGYEVLADSWEKPFPAFERQSAFYEGAELVGNPVQNEGCGELEFEPTIGVTPTTNATDSPAGLDVTVHQPQEMKLGSRSPAPLRDAVVRFPAGLAVNPAQAAGLGACSEEQIGFLGEVTSGEEAGRLDFSKTPQSCPEAAKIGTLEVTSPALVARNEEHETEEDLEGNPVLEPLHGSLYLATPFANPFGKLIATYLVIEDEKTGIVAKLAGKGELDPQSGQLTTYFKHNPEMPIEDIRVHVFGGPRGAFITPPTCRPEGFKSESELTPWSAPEGKDAFPDAGFQMTSAPGGGPCPTSEAQLPFAPKLNAGAQSAGAGKYSPLLFKLAREDGAQRLGKIEATLPTGLSARLAGVAQCSEAEIAKARSRERPDGGAAEQADPSCPAASEVGSVIGAAGAGPTPYYTSGRAYLAGPYKGAPLSAVSIIPAVAGPFDLGTVVVRAGIYLDPATAQGRIVSDPLPQILDGVPLDVRSVAVRATRPGFTLNPTSCDEKSFGGQVLSALGAAAPLFERFQVGGCKSLPYEPKLTTRLYGPIHRGGHPRLKAVFTAKAGEANTAAISFTLPRSEFIDQAHFRTICTRVQFAAEQCPAGSVYGHVKVITPLTDYPLEGPVYLRSSSHKLPDVVLALHGPPYQPLFLEADGRVDSVNGGLRVRFQSVPDAPLTKAIVEMQGAKKGLFQNSTNICKGTHRATLKLDGQNGKVHDTKPKLVAQCKGAKGKKKPKGGGHHH